MKPLPMLYYYLDTNQGLDYISAIRGLGYGPDRMKVILRNMVQFYGMSDDDDRKWLQDHVVVGDQQEEIRIVQVGAVTGDFFCAHPCAMTYDIAIVGNWRELLTWTKKQLDGLNCFCEVWVPTVGTRAMLADNDVPESRVEVITPADVPRLFDPDSLV